MKRLFVLLLMAAAAAAGWYFGRHGASATGDAPAKQDGRKVLFYQSSMHPWIKSDKPGNCTICGMKLTPVYEGEQPKSVEGEFVQLSSNSVTVLNVRTSEVGKHPLKRSLRAAGVLEEDETRRRVISAYVPGRLDELYVNFVGAEVKAGAPLAKFYSPDLLAAEHEYMTLVDRSAGNQTLVQAAALRLKRMGLTEAQVSELPKKSTATQHSEIVAPISGTVVNRMVVAGQYVMEGEKLFEMADFSKLWLQANIYEQDLPWIKTGLVARITAVALPGREFSGKVAFISPSLDAMTRSALVRIELENPLVDGKRLLSHRLFAEAAFEVESEPVVTIERAAVLNPGGAPFTYVDHGGGAYEKRGLKLGRRGDDRWEVLEGVSEGDKVVLDGGFLIDSQAQLDRGHAGSTNEHSEHGGHP